MVYLSSYVNWKFLVFLMIIEYYQIFIKIINYCVSHVVTYNNIHLRKEIQKLNKFKIDNGVLR